MHYVRSTALVVLAFTAWVPATSAQIVPVNGLRNGESIWGDQPPCITKEQWDEVEAIVADYDSRQGPQPPTGGAPLLPQYPQSGIMGQDR